MRQWPGFSKLKAIEWHDEWRIVLFITAFISGIGLFFGLRVPLPTAVYIVLLFLFLIPGLRLETTRDTLRFLAAAVLAGAFYADIRTSTVSTKLLQSDLFFTGEATIHDIDDRASGFPRVTLVALSTVPDDGRSWPSKIRLTVRTEMSPDLVPGDRVKLSAVLNPPPKRISPTGYDFRRAYFFDGIEATGFATTAIKPIKAHQRERVDINRLRYRVAQVISTKIEGDAGALAAALLVGKRAGLPEQVIENMREAGLAHMLAISGLHMGLFVGATFFIFETLFLLFPRLVNRVDSRKLASILALITATFYLIFSGMSIATIRAYGVAVIAVAAILMDRRVISLRSLALAAGFIAILTPQAVLSAGFQMSFSATAGLVVFYQYLRERRSKNYSEGRVRPERSRLDRYLERIGRFLLYTCLTTVVAQIAVAPFVLAHFQTLSLYGVLANMVAVPLLLFVVVPSFFAAVIFSPLGLDWVFLFSLQWGLEQILDVAAFIAGLDRGTLSVRPVYSWVPYGSFIAGILAIIAVRHYRLALGALVLSLALPFVGSRTPPSLIISNNARAVMYVDKDKIYAANLRRGSFQYDAFLSQWGHLDADVDMVRWQCDYQACILDAPDVTRLLSLSAVRDECSRAKIVILARRWQQFCRGPDIILTEEELEEKGPALLTKTYIIPEHKRGYHLEWSNPETAGPNARPWH